MSIYQLILSGKKKVRGVVNIQLDSRRSETELNTPSPMDSLASKGLFVRLEVDIQWATGSVSGPSVWPNSPRFEQTQLPDALGDDLSGRTELQNDSLHWKWPFGFCSRIRIIVKEIVHTELHVHSCKMKAEKKSVLHSE